MNSIAASSDVREKGDRIATYRIWKSDAELLPATLAKGLNESIVGYNTMMGENWRNLAVEQHEAGERKVQNQSREKAGGGLSLLLFNHLRRWKA